MLRWKTKQSSLFHSFNIENNVEEEEGNVDDEEDEDQEERIKEELPTLKD